MTGSAMGEDSELLTQFRSWFDDVAIDLRDEGLLAYLDEGSPELPQRALWVTVESTSRVGRLIIWDTGEATLSLGDAKSGEEDEQYREISGKIGLVDATQTLLAWVRN